MSVTCCTNRVMTRFLQAKKNRQAQACEGRARGESSLGLRTLGRWISRRAMAAGSSRRSWAQGLSKVRWHCSARRARGQKTKTRVDQRSTRVFAFPWRGGASFCVCAAAPRQATKAGNQRSRNSYAGFRPRQSPARPKQRYNAKSRVDRRSTRVFAFSWRRGPAASNQGQKLA